MVPIRRIMLFSFSASLTLTMWSMGALTISDVQKQYSESSIQPDAEAMQIIDTFWQKQLDKIMLSEDSEEIVSVRLELKKYKGVKDLSFYTSTYIKTAHVHLKVAIDTVSKWTEKEKRLRVERNLMILVSELNSIDLVDLAIPNLQDTDSMVRYWAVRSITGSSVISQLKSDVTGDPQKTVAILSALKEHVSKYNDPQSMPFIAEFAIEMNVSESLVLLQIMADKRIDSYIQGQVTDEIMDTRLLQSIAQVGMDNTSPAVKSEMMQRFGQLYACVIMRYMQVKDISQASKDQLITVIAGIEDFAINKMVVGWNSKFRLDMSKNQPLDKDYEMLFGTSGRAGELAGRMNFNFGKDSSGKVLLNPRPLAESSDQQPSPTSKQ